MKQWIKQKNHAVMHAFWYVSLALFGSVSLFMVPGTVLAADIQDVVLLAKAYTIDEIDMKKENMEECSSMEDKKVRGLSNSQPKWLTTSFFLRVVLNQGKDLAYASSMKEYRGWLADHVVLPLGAMAPPVYHLA